LKSRIAVAIAGLAFIALFFFGIPFPVVVLIAAAIGFTADRLGIPVASSGSHGAGKAAPIETDRLGDGMPVHARPDLARAVRTGATWLVLWLAPVALLLVVFGPDDVFSRLAIFFSQVAVVSFGGAYAVLAYVAQQAVGTYGWLRPGEMLAGLGMAETTPGPLIMVVQHVGFLAGYRAPGILPPLLAGTLAGLLVTWVTFTPCFLWVFLGAPYVEALRGARGLGAALSAVTAAVVGVILNLAVWFGLHVVFRQLLPWHNYGFSLDMPVLTSIDPFATTLAIAAALALFRFKIGVIPTLIGCSIAGVVLVLAFSGVR
jgi:chromate transporter